MPKVVISIDGVVSKEVSLTKDRTTLGRRPYNDIVIDNLAVSGEHAVFQMSGPEVHIEDLNSTNGTYINGKAVTKQHLKHNDKIEIGKHTIRFVSEADVGALEKTMIMKKPPSAVAPTSEPLTASIRVVSGSAAGREVGLTKVVTTIGKPGVAVAAITRRPHGYVVALVEGANKATLNNHPLDQEAQTLKSGDVLELAGTKMEFIQG